MDSAAPIEAPTDIPVDSPLGEPAPPAPEPGILSDGLNDPPPAPSSAPELSAEWRQDLLGPLNLEGDELDSASKLMGRFNTPSAAIKSLIAGQKMIRSGELKNGLPENPNDQQLTDWRQANNVPASPDGYDLQLSDGIVLGDDDKTLLAPIMEVAHKANVSNSAMSEIVSAFAKQEQDRIEDLQEQTKLAGQNMRSTLKAEWGPDYKTNMNMVESLIAQAPGDSHANFLNATGGDGKPLLSDPAIVNMLADFARTINPSATVIPNSDTAGQDIKAEIQSLQGQMGDDDWHTSPEKADRYMKLITVRDQMKTNGQM